VLKTKLHFAVRNNTGRNIIVLDECKQTGNLTNSLQGCFREWSLAVRMFKLITNQSICRPLLTTTVTIAQDYKHVIMAMKCNVKKAELTRNVTINFYKDKITRNVTNNYW